MSTDWVSPIVALFGRRVGRRGGRPAVAEVFVVGDDDSAGLAGVLGAAAASAVDNFVIDHPLPCRACGSWLAAGDRLSDHRCDGAR